MNSAIKQLLGYTLLSLFCSLTVMVNAETVPTTPPAAAEPAGATESTSGQPASPGATRVGSLDTVELRKLALASEAQAQELVWLEVQYPEQQGSQKVLALEQKPRSLPTRGAILLLHDKGQHANWPYVIRSLRMGLPDSGWYTLAVNLPHDEEFNAPSRSLAAKSTEQIVLTDVLKQALEKPPVRSAPNPATTVDEESTKNPQASSNEPQSASPATTPPTPAAPAAPSTPVDIDLAKKQRAENATLAAPALAEYHIKAAMNHLRSSGYQNIVIIGYRAGADLALNHLQPIAQSIPGQGFALVLIDPILQQHYQADIAQALGQNFRAPVLDIFNETYRDRQTSAAERAASARMASIAGYQQLGLITDESDEAQQTLLRRVRFWLEKYASPTPIPH